MIKQLDFIIREPKSHNNGCQLTWEIYKNLTKGVRISKDLNEYLKNKKVIVVGPSPYLINKNKGDFINSFDVIIRFNKGWKIDDNFTNDYGNRTDILWHCMKTESCGFFKIDDKLNYGIKWIISQFPRNLDYFDADIKKFELDNKERIKFDVFSDLIFFLNIQNYLGTRPNIGVSSIIDLLNYDIKSLHVSGFSFYKDGYFFKDDRSLKLTNHKIEPQIEMLKILNKNIDKLTFDQEINEQLISSNLNEIGNYNFGETKNIILENELINKMVLLNHKIRDFKRLIRSMLFF